MNKVREFFSNLWDDELWRDFRCHFGFHQPPHRSPSDIEPGKTDFFCPHCGLVLKTVSYERPEDALHTWVLDG